MSPVREKGMDPYAFLHTHHADIDDPPCLSFEDELRLVGVPDVPQEPFYKHRKKLLEPYRIGAGAYLWPIGVFLEKRPTLNAIVLLLFFAGIYGIGLGAYHDLGSLLLSGLSLSCVTFLMIHAARHHGRYWREEQALDPAHICSIPPSLLVIAQKVMRTIPRATIIIESFENDPLLSVRRDSEIYYLGGWNTGNSEIDPET